MTVLVKIILSIFLISCTFSKKEDETKYEIPEKNKDILKFIEDNGSKIAPTYETAVCTEFVIAVLENFTRLSKDEKRKIRIITPQNLEQLRINKNPIITGIQYALTSSGKGIKIDKISDLREGDFFQFWFTASNGTSQGHCGVVKKIDVLSKKISIYSSHPATGGFGVLKVDVTDEFYFVRLK
jgi:hypothetical protein